MFATVRTGAVSRLVLAATLATGMSLVAAPAAAQKASSANAGAAAAGQTGKSNKKGQAAGEVKANLSKGFAAAYKPYYELYKAGGDVTTLRGSIPAIQAAAQTADDKYTAGQATYNIGVKVNDIAMQRQGVGLMVSSNSPLAGSDRAGQIYAAGKLAYQDKDWAAARTYFEQAVSAGYTGEVEPLLAETYYQANQTSQGFGFMDQAIAKKVAAGQPVPEAWLKRTFSVAYNNKLGAEAAKYAALHAQYYPSAESWGNAIAILRNANGYDGQELLDVMRLAERTKTLRTERDYVDYISASDARRLPGETQRIIKAGMAAGVLKTSDVFVREANTVSSSRLAADTADLPKLGRDAALPSASAATLMAAGDAFLSYQRAAEAERFYTLALAKPGVDTARVLTRLGIAQADQGKAAEAQATFAKVQGARQPIARLWALYAQQRGATAS